MKMTLKQAIEHVESRPNMPKYTNEALELLITHARATEHAPLIGKRVYYNGVKGRLGYCIIYPNEGHGLILEPSDIRPLPSATLTELKQAYCEYHGVDDVEVEG
jgi:hypothetical protein